MPLGTCALCSQLAELQDSHLMPRGVYKALREPHGAVHHPVLVTASTTIQTGAQVHDYLLCSGCEMRFAQNGEDWVMKNSPHRNGRFPLREALLRSPVKSTIPIGEIYKEPFDAGFDLERLIYFGASVFWRASVHHWSRALHLTKRAPLTPAIQERLRLFLMHEDGFPIDAVLLISVTASKPLAHCILPSPMVRASRDATANGYSFAIPGLQFRLLYDLATEDMTRVSVALPPHAVVVTDRVEKEIRAGAEVLRKTSRPVGSLSAWLDEGP
jgi:hypothetical protein